MTKRRPQLNDPPKHLSAPPLWYVLMAMLRRGLIDELEFAKLKLGRDSETTTEALRRHWPDDMEESNE